MLLAVACCAAGFGGLAPESVERIAAPDATPGLAFVSQQPGSTTEGDSAEAKARKRTLVQSAMYVVVGIAVLGVLLIVVMVLWGIRLRQRNRKKLPREAPLDPLWYLRQGANGESQPPETEEAKPAPGPNPPSGSG